MGRRICHVQQDVNQGKFVGWATEEEIAARQEEMERSVREEVKIVSAHQRGNPSTRGASSSNPILVGFINPHYDISLNLSGAAPPLGTPYVSPTISEAHRITDQFYEDFRVLKAKVAILEAENNALRHMVENLMTPTRVVFPSPPKE